MPSEEIMEVNPSFLEQFKFTMPQLIGRNVSVIHGAKTDLHEWKRMVTSCARGMSPMKCMFLNESTCTSNVCMVTAMPILSNIFGSNKIDRMLLTLELDSDATKLCEGEGEVEGEGEGRDADGVLTREPSMRRVFKDARSLRSRRTSCQSAEGSTTSPFHPGGTAPLVNVSSTGAVTSSKDEEARFLEILSKTPAGMLSRSQPDWIESPMRGLARARTEHNEARVASRIRQNTMGNASPVTVSSLFNMKVSHASVAGSNYGFERASSNSSSTNMDKGVSMDSASQSVLDRSQINRATMRTDKALRRHLQAMATRRTSSSSIVSAASASASSPEGFHEAAPASRASSSDLSGASSCGSSQAVLPASPAGGQSESSPAESLNMKVAAVMCNTGLTGKERHEAIQRLRKETADAKKAEAKSETPEASTARLIRGLPESVAEEGFCTPLSSIFPALANKQEITRAGSDAPPQAQLVEPERALGGLMEREALQQTSSHGTSVEESSCSSEEVPVPRQDHGADWRLAEQRAMSDDADSGIDNVSRQVQEWNRLLSSGSSISSAAAAAAAEAQWEQAHVVAFQQEQAAMCAKGAETLQEPIQPSDPKVLSFDSFDSFDSRASGGPAGPARSVDDHSKLERARSISKQNRRRELEFAEAAIARQGGDWEMVADMARQFIEMDLPTGVFDLQELLAAGSRLEAANTAGDMLDAAESIGAISLIERLEPLSSTKQPMTEAEVTKQIGFLRVELERLARFWRNYQPS